jgi:hypothetical protein
MLTVLSAPQNGDVNLWSVDVLWETGSPPPSKLYNSHGPSYFNMKSNENGSVFIADFNLTQWNLYSFDGKTLRVIRRYNLIFFVESNSLIVVLQKNHLQILC